MKLVAATVTCTIILAVGTFVSSRAQVMILAQPGVAADGGALAEELAAYEKAGEWMRFAKRLEEVIHTRKPRPGGHGFADSVGVRLGGDAWALNSMAWDVFWSCNDKEILTKALGWSDLSLRLQPTNHDGEYVQTVDTRANLLYKLGRVDEAIAEERRTLEPAFGGNPNDSVQLEIVKKMQSGVPTWPVK